MCNSLVHALGCLTLVTFGGFPVDAHVIPVNANTDSNKTNASDQKPVNHIVGKSIQPVMVPYYPSFVAPPIMPLKYQRLQMPIVPPRVPAGYRIDVPVVSSPYVTGYSGLRPPVQQMLVQPMPQFDVPFSRPVIPSRYLQQSVVPGTYNFAPYGSNAYASYAFRSATDEEDESAQSAQYGTRYITQPTEYEIDEPTRYATDQNSLPNLAYSSEGVEPRQVLSAESGDDFVPLSGTSDQIFYELMNPPLVEPSAVFHSEPQPHHVHSLMRRGITEEPSPYVSVSKPYIDLQGTSWIISRGDFNVPLILKT